MICLSAELGNNITKPAETTATQFIVIEDIACAVQLILMVLVQIRINTTDYFQNPDVTDHGQVSRDLASPYPRGSSLQLPQPTAALTTAAAQITADQLA